MQVQSQLVASNMRFYASQLDAVTPQLQEQVARSKIGLFGVHRLAFEASHLQEQSSTWKFGVSFGHLA